MIKTKKNLNQGFTLIELLLYVGIASIILIVTTLFLGVLLESRVKNQAISEIEQQGLQLMQIITQTTRNAENISSPTAGNSSSTLSLDVINTSKDPTVFDLSGGIIRITEGSENTIPLTNSHVSVSSLSFQNKSRANTPGTIRISFTLNYVNPESRYEYDYVKSFISSATLRQP
ncbi:MAG: hypothetical protein ACD_24C00390G0005 [uncultured bacterium]|uniref:Type II secretion system protein n=1 Tax=candidate division WWE3 bacterium RBG_16_37_10 TaxID=1802610 RepID=A0A1F4UU37_UNCKA|nr:MAG: hypothetical protein ACD_24C00390G0005 [uncultured bacterium]OGC48471.1 MAG: hypothetical protein A2W32_05185 [candidate division WWE3 bacterium RBG_16_37_10]